MDYQLLLKNHSLKVTPQRVGILSLMFQAGHISVEDLYERIKKEFPSISLATLYKNINAMSEKGLIKEVKVPHSKNVYEITKEKHAHLLCNKCHAFMDVDVELTPIIKEATTKSHFQIQESDVVFSGLCPKCVA